MTVPRYRFLLDSDTCSFIIKSHPRVLERFAEANPFNCCISAVVYAEQRLGMEKMTPGSRTHQKTISFLESIAILEWDVAAADVFASMLHELRRSRQVIGDRDTMIAAHARSIGATLVTNNERHFRRIGDQLVIENWLVD